MDKVDRLSVRERPAGLPLMEHQWGKLLFMHWPVPAQSLRALVPERLSIDTFDNVCWIGVTPFTLWDVRLTFTPAIPWLSHFHELNVRTYVHLDGVPGVWFFSLDANSRANVAGARTFFHLPYFYADIQLEQSRQTISFKLERKDAEKAVGFSASWNIGDRLSESNPDSLEFFLTERYCLYSTDGANLYRARIHHPPWPLQKAELLNCESSMTEAQGLPATDGDPLIHYSEALEVHVWPLEKV